jgi:hypothetical protein
MIVGTESSTPASNNGKLREDVIAVLRGFPPDVVQGLMTEVPDAEHDVSQTLFLALRTILADAASRGPPRVLRLPSTSRDTNYSYSETSERAADRRNRGRRFLSLVSTRGRKGR